MLFEDRSHSEKSQFCIGVSKESRQMKKESIQYHIL
eukprot:UN28261